MIGGPSFKGSRGRQLKHAPGVIPPFRKRLREVDFEIPLGNVEARRENGLGKPHSFRLAEVGDQLAEPPEIGMFWAKCPDWFA